MVNGTALPTIEDFIPDDAFIEMMRGLWTEQMLISGPDSNGERYCKRMLKMIEEDREGYRMLEAKDMMMTAHNLIRLEEKHYAKLN